MQPGRTVSVWEEALPLPRCWLCTADPEVGDTGARDTPEVEDALGDTLVTLIGMCHHLTHQPFPSVSRPHWVDRNAASPTCCPHLSPAQKAAMWASTPRALVATTQIPT